MPMITCQCCGWEKCPVDEEMCEVCEAQIAAAQEESRN